MQSVASLEHAAGQLLMTMGSAQWFPLYGLSFFCRMTSAAVLAQPVDSSNGNAAIWTQATFHYSVWVALFLKSFISFPCYRLQVL